MKKANKIDIFDGVRDSNQLISKEISCRITSLRFILIVFVVFIHNNLSYDDAINYYHLSFYEPALITWFKFLITYVFGSAAVPLFFLFSAYLQFAKRDDYKTLLKKKTKSLLIPYVLWTLLSVLIFFIAQTIPQLANFFQNEKNFVQSWSFVDWLNLFWVHADGCPFVYQFWFLRNLLVLIIFSPFLSFIAKKYPFLVLIGMIFCYFIELPLKFGQSFFFYMLGWYFVEYKISFFRIADKIKWIEYIIMIIFILFLNVFLSEKIIFYRFVTIIGCLFLMKVSKLIVENANLFSFFSYLSGFSFFLYAIHQPFLETALNKISYKIIPLHGIGCLVQFIVPCFICIFIGTGIGILLKKWIRPIFNLLNGSR